MTRPFRRVPAASDPEASPYYAAERVVIKRSSDDVTRNKFKWWFVDHYAEYSNATDAWNSSEWTAYLNSS
jgi:hypothetical protein